MTLTLDRPATSDATDVAVAETLRRLAIVWARFEARLEATPLIRKLTRGRFELADYHAFLIQLRQQVKDGSLWMSRAASNIDEQHLQLRSTLMRHAVTEHRDFRLLEEDFTASGGDLDVIRAGQKDVGSEALSAWMFHEASKPNPFGRLGAMFIIEGLGSIKAAEWGRLVCSRLALQSDAANSLQLDEAIGVALAKILGTPYHLAFVKNGHPLVQISTLQAGFRLMMHGLDCEGIHGWLRAMKHRQAMGLPVDPRTPTADAPAAATAA